MQRHSLEYLHEELHRAMTSLVLTTNLTHIGLTLERLRGFESVVRERVDFENSRASDWWGTIQRVLTLEPGDFEDSRLAPIEVHAGRLLRDSEACLQFRSALEELEGYVFNYLEENPL